MTLCIQAKFLEVGIILQLLTFFSSFPTKTDDAGILVWGKAFKIYSIFINFFCKCHAIYFADIHTHLHSFP